MAGNNLSKEEQLIAAIEMLALGRHYVIQSPEKRKKMNTSSFINFLAEMRDPFVYLLETGLERKYSNYKKHLETRTPSVLLNFQSGYITVKEGNADKSLENSPETVRELFAIYLKSLTPLYNQSAVDTFFMNFAEKADALYYLAVLKYSIQYRLPIDVSYTKTKAGTTKDVRIFPLAIACKDSQLNLIGIDLAENKTKRYMMGGIKELNSDLHKNWLNRATFDFQVPAGFDIVKFYHESEGNFQREPVRYRLDLFGSSYSYFMNTHISSVHNFKVVQERSPKNVSVEFDSFSEQEIFGILAHYGEWCRLVSPKDAVKRFVVHLRSMLSKYE